MYASVCVSVPARAPLAGGTQIYSVVSSYMMTLSEKEDASKRRAEFLMEVDRDREHLKGAREEIDKLKAEIRKCVPVMQSWMGGWMDRLMDWWIG